MLNTARRRYRPTPRSSTLDVRDWPAWSDVLVAAGGFAVFSVGGLAIAGLVLQAAG
jgi:hypothetical protein